MSNRAAENLKSKLVYAVRNIAPDYGCPMEQILKDATLSPDAVCAKLDETLSCFLYACFDDAAPLELDGSVSERMNCFSYCYIYSRWRDRSDCRFMARAMLETLCEESGMAFHDYLSFCDAQFTGIVFMDKFQS